MSNSKAVIIRFQCRISALAPLRDMTVKKTKKTSTLKEERGDTQTSIQKNKRINPNDIRAVSKIDFGEAQSNCNVYNNLMHHTFTEKAYQLLIQEPEDPTAEELTRLESSFDVRRS